MAKAAIYSRVSTHDQKTLSMQIKKCSEYALARGWDVVTEIKEVGSGATQRPQRSDLLKLCRKRQVDVGLTILLFAWCVVDLE